MELIVPLNVQGDRPLYEQIYQYIKDEIRKGNIRPEKQLPSSRDLAKSLKVSRSTTQLAYEQLVSEGYLEAVPRKGYFAASLDGIFPPVAQRAAARPDQKKELSFGMKKENAGEQLFSEKIEVDFSPRGIDLEGFPYATWRKISRAVLKEEDRDLFLKGDPQGDLILREAIREYLHAARGVNCDASQIIIGAGNEYLLMLLSLLIGKDAVIAMEDPTYRQAYRVLSGVGHKVLPVGIDKNGFCVKELEDQTAQAAYVMPSHQFPTGIVMPVKRRQELLSWAGKMPGRYLIEDDYDSEFRFSGRPLPTLQSIDSNGRVIYMNTFSQTIAPSMRIGFLVLPPQLLEEYRKRLDFYACPVPATEQSVLARFIAGGQYEQHLSRMRNEYRSRRLAVLEAFRKSPFSQKIALVEQAAGLHFLLQLDTQHSDQELKQWAEQCGVRLSFLSEYARIPQASFAHTLVINYAGLSPEQLPTSMELLGKVFSHL